jgi:hypothetical protein
MRILIAAPSHQTVTAVEIISRSIWPGATFVLLARSARAAVPPQSVAAVQCDLCVLDLLGLGWSRWSNENEERLNILLSGRSAILLLPPGNSGDWPDTDGSANQHSRVTLQRPISTTALREALRSVAEASAHLRESELQRRRDANVWMRRQYAGSPTTWGANHSAPRRGSVLLHESASRMG